MKWVEAILSYRPGALARGSLHTMGVFGIRLVIQIILLFLLARYLGPASFGEYAAIAALAVLFGALSSLGIGFLVLIDFSKDSESGIQTYRKALKITLLSACLLLPLYFLISQSLVKISATTPTLMMIGLSELVLMPLLLVQAKRLQGLGQTAYGQMLLTSPLIARLGLLVFAIEISPCGGLEIYAQIYLLTSFLALIMGSLATKAHFEYNVYINPLDKRIVKRGIPYAFMRMASLGPGETDKSIAPRLLGASEAGAYAMATRGMAIATLPVTALLLAIQPRILSSKGKNSNRTRFLLSIVLAGSFFYSLCISLLFFATLPSIAIALLGPDFEHIEGILKAVAFIAPLVVIRLTLGGFMTAYELPLPRTIAEFGGTVTLVLFALIAVPFFATFGLILAIAVAEATMILAFAFALLKLTNQSISNS